MTETFTIEVELLFIENEEQVEIDVQCDYSIENNGIGAYEYWGANGVDRSVDYAVIEDTRWNVCDDLSVYWCFTKEQNNIIESAIEAKIKDWEDSITDRANDARCDSCFYSEDDSN